MTRIASPRLSVGLLTALVLALCVAAPARADVGATIINRCTHGQSLAGFTQQDYSKALQELPTEVEEYSDCANLIRRAQLASAAGGGGGSGAAQAIPLSPSERRTLARALKSPTPVQVGGRMVSPGVVNANVASALSTLPDPLLALLAFLLACALVLAGGAIRNRVRSRRSS
jgi:hypothetical protein